MKKQIVFGAAHTPEFMDKWLADNEKPVSDLIESGELEVAPCRPKRATSAKKRSSAIKRAASKPQHTFSNRNA